MEEKARAKARKDYPERKRLQGVFKAKAKADREAYLRAIIDEVEKDLQCNRLGSAFKAIKQISGKQTHSNPVSINKADGSPCENEDEVCYAGRSTLNRPLTTRLAGALLHWTQNQPLSLLMPQPQPTSLRCQKLLKPSPSSETAAHRVLME